MMANEKSNAIETKNVCDDDSIDINEKLVEFVLYLKIGNDCQTLLKLSELELLNEIKFKKRAEKILNYQHKYDQIIIEKKIINDLQQSIIALTSDLGNEIDKEKLESKNITKICDKMMNLKLLSIKDCNDMKSLRDFIKLNKISLKDITKIENEIKVVLEKLPSIEQSSRKSETKISRISTWNNTRNRRSSLSLSTTSRRTDQDNNSLTPPRNLGGRLRLVGNINNNDIIVDTQTYTNEFLRLRLENEHSRIVENFINRSNIDQNTRFRQNEDLTSNDLIMGSIDDDLVEFSSLNSAMNLCKDNDDNNSGDVHLILNPQNSWMNT